MKLHQRFRSDAANSRTANVILTYFYRWQADAEIKRVIAVKPQSAGSWDPLVLLPTRQQSYITSAQATKKVGFVHISLNVLTATRLSLRRGQRFPTLYSWAVL